MTTRNVGKPFNATSVRELDLSETKLVSGGALPALVFLGVGTVLGAAEGAASARANGQNVTGGAILGGVSGAIGGVAGAVWKTSKTAGVVLAGVAGSLRVSGAFGGNRITVFER